jgi:homoserine dehydrogenase
MAINLDSSRGFMNEFRLALVGFGNVGRAFTKLLLDKKQELKDEYQLQIHITGISTKSHGQAIDQNGIDLEAALNIVAKDQKLDEINQSPEILDTFDFIQKSRADILIETIPVNYLSGEPALSFHKYALEKGMHVVTANKGPVVHGYHQLSSIARERNNKYYFESAVMDGAPIFSLFRNALPALKVMGFEGILNSTTNKILCLMEDGSEFDEAVSYTQKIGIAETDPSGDIDGWDAAVKVAALVTVLMKRPILPVEITREGIRQISRENILDAQNQGKRWKLLCSAHLENDRLVAKVAPIMVEPKSVFYSVEGTSSLVEFETDLLGKFAILEQDPSPDTTAYGLFADLLDIGENDFGEYASR